METIDVTREGPIVRVRLNRPDVRNAFNQTLMTEVTQVFQSIDGACRGVVLSGAGSVFSAGVDVHWMTHGVACTPQENRREAEALALMLRAVDECPCPVVAGVHGSAIAGGAVLIACCDVVVAVPEALFGFTEVRLGVDPAVIFPFVLPKIGMSWARRYILTGELFGASEAARIGLVHEIVPPEMLDERVGSVVQSVLKAGPVATVSAKRSLREFPALDREEAHRRTVATLAEMRVSPEGLEGLSAFLERRAPKWVPPK